MAAGPKRILKGVLELVSPSRKEVLAESAFARSIIRKIANACPKGCKVVLAGSVAKGTFLRDSKDLDIFVLVGKGIPKASMENMLKSIIRKAYPGIGHQLSYAEHPYLRFHLEGRRIDLVPAYSIRHAGERLSAVDRSVLHTKYILKNLKKSRKGDVLLLKKFLKANSLYGAEIKTEGFPGYLCELLILRYGSFMKLVRTAPVWKLPIVIDSARHYGKKELGGLPEKFSSSLVVIDPTDRNRNVAAALSEKNLKAFISLCSRFAKSPSSRLFLKAPPTFASNVSAAKRKHGVYLITMPKPDVVDDILWGQLKKLLKQLFASMKEFCPAEPFADDEGAITIALPLGKSVLPEKEILLGPPLGMGGHLAHFRKAHKGAKFMKKNGRLCAVRKRKIRKAEDAISEFFRKYSAKGTHLSNPLSKMKIEKA
ncbi:MAG: CCA tRNA nucleotidyltransferase [Candidatus Micrarchaeota archaeon]